jgi:hypothetical protein
MAKNAVPHKHHVEITYAFGYVPDWGKDPTTRRRQDLIPSRMDENLKI